MANTTESLNLKLSLSGLASVEAGFKSLANSIGSLGKLLPGLVGGFAFEELARHSINFAEQIGKASKSTGIAIEQLAGLSYVADKSEVSFETLQRSLKTFSEWLTKTGQGSRDVKEALVEQSKLFASLPDGAGKATLAVERFGKAGAAMIPLLDEGPQKLEALFERGQRLSGVTERMAEVSERFNDSLRDLKTSAEGFAGAITASILPAMTELFEKASDGLATLREFIGEFQNWWKFGDPATKAAVGVGARGKLDASLLPKGGGWSPEELALQNKIIDGQRALLEIGTAKTALDQKSLGLLFVNADKLHAIAAEELLINEKRVNAQAALEQGAIADLEFEQADIAARKELLSLDQKRAAISESERQFNLAKVRGNFRLSDQDKFEKSQQFLSKDEREVQGPNPVSFTDQLFASLARIQTETGTIAQNIGKAFETGFNTAADAITGLIDRTKTLGQALQQISTTFIHQIIESIIRMGAQWVLTHVIMAGALAIFHAVAKALGWAAATDTIQQESAKAPGLAVNAVNASTSSFGAASIIGIAAMVAAIGIGVAAALGAFAEGGYTGSGGKYDVAGVVHRGEVVIPSEMVSQPGALPALQHMLATGNVIKAMQSYTVSSAIKGYADGGYVGDVSRSEWHVATSNSEREASFEREQIAQRTTATVTESAKARNNGTGQGEAIRPIIRNDNTIRFGWHDNEQEFEKVMRGETGRKIWIDFFRQEARQLS